MKLYTAQEFTLETLTRFWNLGYTGYFMPVTFTEQMLANWLRCGDFDLARSLIALDGDALVGFSFLGARGRRGWIGGFGIAPDYRGQGLAQAIFTEHIERVAPDFRTIQLEVLVQNWARKVYERSGFAVARRLAILQGVPRSDRPVRIQVAPPVPLLAHHYRLHLNCPAVWQREPSWLKKSLPVNAEALFTEEFASPTGYLVVAPVGDGVRIVDGAAESATAAEALVAMLARRYPGKNLVAVNEPEGGPLHGALTAAGLTEANAQWEMRWSQ